MKRKYIQCRSKVSKGNIKRENIDGVEHVIIKSFTLPDNIVMNGVLYPSKEIDESFQSLERTLAPVEHPIDANGKFISASDPIAINNFYAGAFNANVRKEGGRIAVDKMINVQEALKTERGKRLLDRIDDIENNEEARPIHTSVGVFLALEELEEPQTNSTGEYFAIARDLFFDHDAILLDSVAAATPDKGVGIGVNAEGDQFEVDQFEIEEKETIESQSVTELQKSVHDAISESAIGDGFFIEELFADHVIFSTSSGFFDVPFVLDDNGRATIVGIPLAVERRVTYPPKTNSLKGNAMKDMIVNALKTAEIEVEGLTDAQLFDAYNSFQANQNISDENKGADEKGDLAEIVANALAPLTEKLANLETKIQAEGETELNRLADIVGNSEKYAGLDAVAAKKLGTETLKEMADNCQDSYGVSPIHNNNSDSAFQESELPA